MIRAPAAGMSGKRLLLPQDNLKMGALDGHDREIFVRGLGCAGAEVFGLHELKEDPIPGGNQARGKRSHH
jgi:hypothetical protein